MMLLDTNVLVYAVDTRSQQHQKCHAVVARGMAGALDAVLVPQVLTEFLAVVTSPRGGSLLPPSEAIDQVTDWRAAFPIRLPDGRSLDELEALVRQVPRSGQRVYDLFLAAQMRAHGIAEICTVDSADFAGIPDITVRSPESV